MDNDEEGDGDDDEDDERFVERSCVKACKGLKMRRKMAEKGEAEERGLSGEREEGSSSSEMTQSTRTTTFSTWGTREWNLLETTPHRPRALTSPMRLKTRRRMESGRWSKKSGGSSGSGWIRESGSERWITAMNE